MLSDGAMGTMLYDRGIFINRCFDELNLSQPEIVAGVHAEYLQAGAEIIETNTFGANAFRLERYGLRDRVREINLAGVRIARQCVAQIAEKQASRRTSPGPSARSACGWSRGRDRARTRPAQPLPNRLPRLPRAGPAWARTC